MWASSTRSQHVGWAATGIMDARHISKQDFMPGFDYSYYCSTCGVSRRVSNMIRYNLITSYDRYYSIDLCENCDAEVQKRIEFRKNKTRREEERLNREELKSFRKAMRQTIRAAKKGRVFSKPLSG